MQMSNILEIRNIIFYVIWSCLLVVLSWSLFALATSILYLLSIGKEIKSGKTKGDHLETGNILRNAGNQFLAQSPVGNECNHADLVPVQETVTSGSNLRQFATKSLTSGFDNLKNNYNDTTIAEMIHANFENEIIMTEPLNGSSNDIEQKIGFQWVFNKEKRNEKTMINEEENLWKMCPSSDVNQFKEECSNDITTMMKRVSIDSRDKNYAKNTFDHGNEMSKNEKERLSNLEMKIEEDRDASVSRLLAAKFLALILQESSPFRMGSKELRKEGTMVFGTNTSMESGQPSGKHKTEDGIKADENESRVFDKFGKSLTRTNDSKICSQKGNDYPEERFGVVPEIEANCMEEESAMYPRNATQSRIEGREKGEEKEEVEPPPERNPLKNDRGTESTIFLGRPQSTCYDKEEKDLNAMIRRMIISELKSHRMKKQTVLKRAYSDTEFNNQMSKTRTGPFSLQGRTFFQDLLGLEESTRTKVESTSGSECTVTRIDETIVERVESTEQKEICSKEDVEVDVPPVDHAHDAINFLQSSRKIDSTILLERKVSVPCLAETEQSIEIGNDTMAHERIQLNKTTQTEYVHVIRAIRSCPLRKKNLPLRFQLHLTSRREAVSSKTVFASIDCSRFVFRKASDNLIYEKGKASGSPSYVPNPERFRWKYVMPSTVK